MDSLLPLWSDERSWLTAQALGMPPGAEWAIVWCEHPIDRRGLPPRICIRRASQPAGTASRFSLPRDEVRPLQGFRFQLFGRVAQHPITEYWQFEPTPGLEQGLNIEKWWMGVQIGTSMIAELRYDPARGECRKFVEIITGGWQRDAHRFVRAVDALDMTIRRGEMVTEARNRIMGGLRTLAAQPFKQKLTRATLGVAVGGIGEDAVSSLLKRAQWKMADLQQIYATLISDTNFHKP